MSTPLQEGQELPVQTYRVTRADLLSYAAASGDDNPIHQSEEVARSVGLPFSAVNRTLRRTS